MVIYHILSEEHIKDHIPSEGNFEIASTQFNFFSYVQITLYCFLYPKIIAFC